MSNPVSKRRGTGPAKRGPAIDVIDDEDITVFTSRLYELNIQAQDAVRDFAMHDIDDREGLEAKRIAMHDAFTELYDEVANFTKQLMGEEFDIAYLRERIQQTEGEEREQLEAAMKELVAQLQTALAETWMAKVVAWLHQAAAVSGPFIEHEHAEKEKAALLHLAEVYTMLERPFVAIPARVDGTQKLRRVALGMQTYSLMKDALGEDNEELEAILGRNKSAEAEFYDEFLNELIGRESTFRQAFNPFDELLWRDILSAFIFERATDLYNEALPHLDKGKEPDKARIAIIRAWKQNTAGLSEVYLAMTYNDIADAQMRAGNLEDAAKLYGTASAGFARAEKCFSEEVTLRTNAAQARSDKEQKKAQSYFCKGEATVQVLLDLIRVNNRDGALETLNEIIDYMKKAEKLSKTRELTGAIKESLRTFTFVEELLKKSDDIRGIIDQIEFAKDLRKTGMIQTVNKALDNAATLMNSDPAEALKAIREGLDTLGILLSIETEDEEIGLLRNRTLALLNHVKYVIQYQQSSELGEGIKFIMSRVLENLHAAEAASYYKVIGEDSTAQQLTDMGRLALATAYVSEGRVFGAQAEQWALRAGIERINTARQMEDLTEFDDEAMERVLRAHEDSIMRIKQAVAAVQSAANELNSVENEELRKKNNIDAQVKHLHGVVMRFKGDLLRLEGARSDFMAEIHYKRGDVGKAKKYYSDANEKFREAVGNYTVAAQMFQQIGDMEAAQRVDSRAKTTDLLARSVWDNRQKLGRDQEPTIMGEAELTALYRGSLG